MTHIKAGRVICQICVSSVGSRIHLYQQGYYDNLKKKLPSLKQIAILQTEEK